MIKETKEYIIKNNMIKQNDTVIAAVSGGADSVCLLVVLDELRQDLRFKLEAVHVEHGIRGDESKSDAEYVKNLCRSINIECHVYNVDVPAFAQKSGMGLEEAARVLRYNVFEDIAVRKKASVAVAHHQEDNAETVLFQMIRGSGMRGLGGIRPVSSKKNVTYIRPLLPVSRSDIENFLEKKDIRYVTDSTNSDVEYSRNRIRHEVMPVLRKINKRAVEHISSAAQNQSLMWDYIESQISAAKDAALKIENDSVTIDIDEFMKLHPALKSELAKEAICIAAGRRKDIGSIHVSSLIELIDMQTGRKINLPYDLTARKSYDKIILSKNKPVQNDGRSSYEIDKTKCRERPVELIVENGVIIFEILGFNGKMNEIPKKSCTKWLDYDKIKNGFVVRKRMAGDYIIIDDMGHRKKLKEYFVNQKIPAEQRNNMWLIAEDNEIIAILGDRSGNSALVSSDTKEVLQITFYGGR